MTEDNKQKLISELMKNIEAIMDYMINDIELEDDEWLTTKNINNCVLIATKEEFIITDRDKFKNLDISERNRFLV